MEAGMLLLRLPSSCWNPSEVAEAPAAGADVPPAAAAEAAAEAAGAFSCADQDSEDQTITR